MDDEKSYTDVLSLAIEDSLQRPVVAFTRPLDALGALPTLRPPLIVTDYFMPQLNGLEFIRLAGAMLPQTPFVLISGHNLSGIALEIARMGMVKSVLAKPFSGRTLVEEILRIWPDHAPRPDADRRIPAAS